MNSSTGVAQATARIQLSDRPGKTLAAALDEHVASIHGTMSDHQHTVFAKVNGELRSYQVGGVQSNERGVPTVVFLYDLLSDRTARLAVDTGTSDYEIIIVTLVNDKYVPRQTLYRVTVPHGPGWAFSPEALLI